MNHLAQYYHHTTICLWEVITSLDPVLTVRTCHPSPCFWGLFRLGLRSWPLEILTTWDLDSNSVIEDLVSDVNLLTIATLRLTGAAHCVLSRTRTKFGERGFCYFISSVWSTIYFMSLFDTNTFKKWLKNVMFGGAYQWLLYGTSGRCTKCCPQISYWAWTIYQLQFTECSRYMWLIMPVRQCTLISLIFALWTVTLSWSETWRQMSPHWCYQHHLLAIINLLLSVIYMWLLVTIAAFWFLLIGTCSKRQSCNKRKC